MILPLSNIPVPIEYPSCDGNPIADNTLQYEWIVKIKGGIDSLFRDDQDVFVAGNLLWYPVEGEPLIRVAPDVLVAFGRPKGYRSSYLQWNEGEVAPQVVFEILSPGNTTWEMIDKRDFYEEHGVEEYFIYDPEEIRFSGWIRRGSVFRSVPKIHSGWTSPRLGVHFEVKDELIVTGPDGKRFLEYVEMARERDQFQEAAKLLKERADLEQQRATEAEEALKHMRALLISKGINPDAAG